MSHDNPRLKDMDAGLLPTMISFAEGSPGACRVLGELVTRSPIVDPESAWGPWSPIFSLDNLDCYGSRIWMFYKDVCGQSADKMIGLMRAVQLGLLSDGMLNDAIDGNKSAVNVDEMLTKVKIRLPSIQLAAQESTNV